MSSGRVVAAATALGVAACVSLSSPRGAPSGSLPSVRVGLQPGSRQMVRILLAGASDTGTISGTGEWGVFDRYGKTLRATLAANEPLAISISKRDCDRQGCTSLQPVDAGASAAPRLAFTIRPLKKDGFVTFRG